MHNNLYKVTKFRVIDLDSIEMDILLIDLGFRLVAELVVCRLWGLDAPEKKNKALTAQLNKWMQQRLSEGLSAGDLWVRMVDKDKYGGRFLGEIFIGQSNLNKLIIEFGYGKPYFGGSKNGLWTEKDLDELREKLNI